MKDTIVIITEEDWGTLHSALFTPDGMENAGVLFCGTSETDDQHQLLARMFLSVPNDLYVAREPYHLEVSPAFYNGVVTDCLRNRVTPVIVHSHPHHGDAWYSPSDDYGETRLLGTLNSLLPGLRPASLVVTQTSATGRGLEDESFVRIGGVKIVGNPISKLNFALQNGKTSISSERYERQIRVFGKEGQQVLQTLKVGIVGVGGIGSLVAEQLTRAGVRDLLLIDDDNIEESNVTRLFGATSRDIGKLKVSVVAKYLRRIGEVKTDAIGKSAVSQSVLMSLRSRDIIFSCVDNDRTRALLNRFAHQYLVPVIDLGTRLDGREGKISASAGRISVVGAGYSCLRCSHHIDSERIRAESMSKSERAKLEREGYIIGVDEPAPAIISINTVVSGLGVTAGLNLFVSLTGKPQPIDQIYDASRGEVFTVAATHEQGCDVCDKDLGLKALGDSQIVSAYE